MTLRAEPGPTSLDLTGGRGQLVTAGEEIPAGDEKKMPAGDLGRDIRIRTGHQDWDTFLMGKNSEI
jgi:hypothetical protein